ncbi:threonine aldolase family protein [Actinoplanes couchii]|uniref:threonine aldolase family protein n=1 Tax=Actinoplanes couchii TaxID=403638 RepID=UPI0019431071|nr:beta-eliminating lyase-related protein [Actinoplanes couchii]MDR6324667.1 threonine aldolase [Actinoplanes couchii]
MSDDLRLRRLTAMRGCDRLLSGNRPKTMRERLADIAAGGDLDAMPDFYDGGPVTELEQRVAGLLGTEAAVFFPSGTMAQQVALRFGAERTGLSTVALHPLSHLEMYERHAYSQLSGLRAVTPTREPRNPTAAEIDALPEPVGSVLLELPMREAGFVLPTWDELVDATAAARKLGARVHFDGARLWESTTHLGRTLPEITALADSVYVSFYKSLDGISGAALAGTEEMAAFARAWRHRHGGQIFQTFPAALSALSGLDRELPRLPEYVRHARTIADALAALPGARVFPHPPHTHQFKLWLPYSADALSDAVLALAEREKIGFAAYWQDADVPGYAVTEITVAGPALEWTADDVAAAGWLLAQELES